MFHGNLSNMAILYFWGAIISQPMGSLLLRGFRIGLNEFKPLTPTDKLTIGRGKVVACDPTYLVVACDPTYLFG